MKMPEYIEREAAADAAIHAMWHGGSALEIERAINRVPVSEVRPIRHGSWLQIRTIRYNGEKPYTQFSRECSCCKYLNKRSKGWHTKFCPNCGARMDLED